MCPAGCCSPVSSKGEKIFPPLCAPELSPRPLLPLLCAGPLCGPPTDSAAVLRAFFATRTNRVPCSQVLYAKTSPACFFRDGCRALLLLVFCLPPLLLSLTPPLMFFRSRSPALLLSGPAAGRKTPLPWWYTSAAGGGDAETEEGEDRALRQGFVSTSPLEEPGFKPPLASRWWRGGVPRGAGGGAGIFYGIFLLATKTLGTSTCTTENVNSLPPQLHSFASDLDLRAAVNVTCFESAFGISFHSAEGRI